MFGFVEAIRNGFEQYVNARGRATRAEFWWWWLAVSVLSLLLEGTTVGALFGLAILLPTITVLVRRLHDTGRSGWWGLVFLIPAIGVLILIVLLALPGDSASNRYGPPRMPSAPGAAAGPGSGSGSAGGWPHGGDTPPRSSGWDDLPPPPPSSR
jgi:uncharacterized membrane protein YhaH (DUF805 family)